MTFGKGVKKKLKERYPSAFSDGPFMRSQITIIDSMSKIKSVPDYITTVRQFLTYLLYPALRAFREHSEGVYFVVDQGSPSVKKLQCHHKRYKNVEPMPDDTELALDGDLPQPWINFTANRKLVYKKLYPLIFEAIISLDEFIPLAPNQWIVVSGLTPDHKTWYKDYNNTQVLPKFENHIMEADTAVHMFIDHHRNKESILIHMNDGDIIPITLLNTFDRLKDKEFVNNVYIRLPGIKANDTYIDVNQLFCLIEMDSELKGVQNKIISVCALIILAGNDFLTDYCKGIGFIPYIWDTFFNHAQYFSNLFLLEIGLTNLYKTLRFPLIDEQYFIKFTYACYLTKYETRVSKKFSSVNLFTLREYCASLKRDNYSIPSNEKIIRFSRHLLWNLTYWLNSHRPYCQKYIDPYYKTEENLSLFGYEMSQDGKNTCLHAKILGKSKEIPINLQKN